MVCPYPLNNLHKHLYFQVRTQTRLSHKMATRAVQVVFQNLLGLSPYDMNNVLNLTYKFDERLEVPPRILDQSEDMTQLLKLSDNLHSVKNDAQQRSWELFDDQASIVNCLNELNSILVIQFSGPLNVQFFAYFTKSDLVVETCVRQCRMGPCC